MTVADAHGIQSSPVSTAVLFELYPEIGNGLPPPRSQRFPVKIALMEGRPLP